MNINLHSIGTILALIVLIVVIVLALIGQLSWLMAVLLGFLAAAIILP